MKRKKEADMINFEMCSRISNIKKQQNQIARLEPFIAFITGRVRCRFEPFIAFIAGDTCLCFTAGRRRGDAGGSPQPVAEARRRGGPRGYRTRSICTTRPIDRNRQRANASRRKMDFVPKWLLHITLHLCCDTLRKIPADNKLCFYTKDT